MEPKHGDYFVIADEAGLIKDSKMLILFLPDTCRVQLCLCAAQLQPQT